MEQHSPCRKFPALNRPSGEQVWLPSLRWRWETVLPLAARDYLHHRVGQGPLQRRGLAPGRSQPDIELFRRGEHHRHGLRVHRADDIVRFRGEKAVEQVLGLEQLPDEFAEPKLVTPVGELPAGFEESLAA